MPGPWNRWKRRLPARSILLALLGLVLIATGLLGPDRTLLYLGIGLVVVALGVAFEGFGFKLTPPATTADRAPSEGVQATPRVEFSGRRRDALIDRVRTQRIVNGLERSVGHAAEMHLDLRNTPELVKLSFSRSAAEPGRLLAIEDAYAQAGGQLVILGPPGSGKTTEALKLVRSLLTTADRDPSAPVPELLPLASWAKEQRPLLEWLGEQLQVRHGWPQNDARSLIVHHQIIPILDGLDEVAPEHRAACIAAINELWERHRGGPLVVGCRLAEYEQLPERVKLGGAVTVCPPRLSEVDAYLAAAGKRWVKVRDQLQADDGAALRELLSTPLMLSIAVLAYQREGDPSELGAGDDAASSDRLWSRYVSAMIARAYDPRGIDSPDDKPRYREAQVRRWLGWLAFEMRARNETELWLHEWIGPRSLQRTMKAAFGLVLGLVFGLVFGLAFGLVAGMAAGLGARPDPASRTRFDRNRLVVGLVFGLVFGMVFGMAVGLVSWLVVGLGAGPDAAYRRTRFDRNRLVVGLVAGMAFGLVAGLVAGLAVGLAFGLAFGLDVGLVFGLAFGLADGLVALGPDRERIAPQSPLQVIRDSGRISLIVGLIVGLVVGLSVGLDAGLSVGLAFGLIVGLAFGLAFGLYCVVFHYSFRVWLRGHNRGPMRWVSFLEWATSHVLLRTSGASYQWVHLELRDYLARRYADEALSRDKESQIADGPQLAS